MSRNMLNLHKAEGPLSHCHIVFIFSLDTSSLKYQFAALKSLKMIKWHQKIRLYNGTKCQFKGCVLNYPKQKQKKVEIFVTCQPVIDTHSSTTDLMLINGNTAP